MKLTLFNRQIIGVYLLIIGIFILIKLLFVNVDFSFFILLFILFFLAFFSLHLTLQILITKKKKRLIVGAITLLLTSVFFIFYFIFFDKVFLINKIWPILGIFPSIGLIVYYIISNNKSAASIIPGIFIIILSLILLLIINGIIKLNFIKALIILISGMFIFIGLYLIFKKKIDEFKRQINKSNINIKDDNEKY